MTPGTGDPIIGRYSALARTALAVLLSARRVGPAGLVYGLDGSPDMLALARANASKARVSNVRFLLGRIEEVPLPEEHVGVSITVTGDAGGGLHSAIVKAVKPGPQP